MYTIVFDDGQVWQGGPTDCSRWNEMPYKLIKSISYTVGQYTLKLEGYEAYNHIVERVEFVLNAGRPKITKVILMALKDGMVQKYIFNFLTGKSEFEMVGYGQEYYNKPATGWHGGERLDYPHCNIERLEN
jgi:hypothetical protein